MNRLQNFWDVIKKDMIVTLATAAEGRVTMRTVSPVYYEGAVLIFTHAGSTKYRQLQANPRCCIAAGTLFSEATAEFHGPCLLDENAGLREAYCAKFPGAFDEGVENGGRDADFILLRPVNLTGWDYENGFPTAPFELTL